MRTMIRMLVIFVMATLFCSCEHAPRTPMGPTPIQQLQLTPTSVLLEVGWTQTFVVAGGQAPYTWTFNGGDVIPMNGSTDSIRAKAVEMGNRRLTVRSQDGKESTAEVVVQPKIAIGTANAARWDGNGGGIGASFQAQRGAGLLEVEIFLGNRPDAYSFEVLFYDQSAAPRTLRGSAVLNNITGGGWTSFRHDGSSGFVLVRNLSPTTLNFTLPGEGGFRVFYIPDNPIPVGGS